MRPLSKHSLAVDGSQRRIRFTTRNGIFGFADRHVGTGRLVRAQVREDQATLMSVVYSVAPEM